MSGYVKKRAVAVLAAVCAVSASWAASAANDEQALYEAARKEPAMTWYEVPISQSDAQRVAGAFEKKYPGLTVSAQRSPAGTIFQKVEQEVAAKAPGGDVYTSSVIGDLSLLKSQHALLHYVPDNLATLTSVIPGIKATDPDGYYYPTILDNVAIIYNTQKLTAAQAPHSYKEFLDPKWKNQIAVPNPATSGTFGALTVTWLNAYGTGYFDSLAKNGAMVVRSLPDDINTVESGERAVGVGPAPFALAAKHRGQPIDVVYASEGTLFSECVSGILAKTKSPATAKLFMEFMLSPEMSKLMVQSYNEPMHDNTPRPADLPALKDVHVVVVPPEEIKQKLPIVIQAWRNAFGM